MKQSFPVVAGLVAALIGAPSVAAADCMGPGQAALDGGKFAQAVTAFEIALENPACGTQIDALNLGLATAIHREADETKNGRRYCDAVQKYILASESPDAAIAEKGKAGLGVTRAPCDEAWKGSLAVKCTPGGGEVQIERLGDARKCPATYEGIKAGTYQGEFRAEGRSTPFIATVTPGAAAEVSVELPPVGVGGGEVSTWAWVTAGAAVAALAGAGVSYLRAGQLADQAGRRENAGDFDDLKADYDTQGVLFYGLIGAGVALGGVATWLFLDTDDPPDSGATATVTPDGFGVGWRGTW